jgi:Protein of unknown function (DUF2384)
LLTLERLPEATLHTKPRVTPPPHAIAIAMGQSSALASTERKCVENFGDSMPRLARPNSTTSNEEAALVGRAAFRAADFLDMSGAELARTIGISEPSVSRLRSGAFVPTGKSVEMAVLFVRLFRGLDAIVGGDAESARSWLRAENLALRGKPLDLIQTAQGLVQAVQHVDSRRARV